MPAHTMRLTCLTYLFAFVLPHALLSQIIRGDTTLKNIALVFTGDEFGEGATFIRTALKRHGVSASFFLTGNFYRNPSFQQEISRLAADGHYLGSHSDKHLLYCDWNNRDSLLVTRRQFMDDLDQSYRELARLQITKKDAHYFLPPYEWYNDSIVSWTHDLGLELVNFTPGTRSTADYTHPGMGNRYVTSGDIYRSIIDFEKKSPSGLNGFILLIHIGTDPARKDKFYHQLPALFDHFQSKGYRWVRIDDLLKPGKKHSNQ